MTGYLDRTGVGGRPQQTMEACSRRSQANFSGVAPEAFQNLLRNKLSSMRWRQIPANRIKVTCWCGSVAESILGEIRRGDVRKNDENLDALVHQLYARVVGQNLQSALQRGVGSPEKRDDDAGGPRRDVCDRSATGLAHGPNSSLHSMKRTHEIDLEQSLELIGIEIRHTAQEADARIVHQHIQSPESLDGAVHQRVDLVALRHIGGDHQRFFLTEFIGQRIERLNVTRSSTTFAPAATKARARAFPMPAEAPVTITVFPLGSIYRSMPQPRDVAVRCRIGPG